MRSAPRTIIRLDAWCMHIDQTLNVKQKMAETSKQGVFVGISEMYKGYVVYFPEDGTFEAAIHCDFVPNEFPL